MATKPHNTILSHFDMSSKHNRKSKRLNLTGLSHVDQTILSMTDEDLSKAREEIIKKNTVIKTGFGDFILFRGKLYDHSDI